MSHPPPEYYITINNEVKENLRFSSHFFASFFAFFTVHIVIKYGAGHKGKGNRPQSKHPLSAAADALVLYLFKLLYV